MYGWMDAWVYVRMNGCMDVWMYVCMYVCIMYVCMYVCMYVFCINELKEKTQSCVTKISTRPRGGKGFAIKTEHYASDLKSLTDLRAYVSHLLRVVSLLFVNL